MIDSRLPLAQRDAGLDLSGVGRMAVFAPPTDATLDEITRAAACIICDAKHEVDHWRAQGFQSDIALDGVYDAALVCLPRQRTLGQTLVAQAMASTVGPVIIDGQKTSGIESMLREMRQRALVNGPVTKAHGKLFWLDADPQAFADWARGPAQTPGGFWTAPGVFSADGIDPGSALLAGALPKDLGRRVADLGAGWGFLSAHVLARPGVQHLDVVEAGHMALECAHHNVTDARAAFHWADATRWHPETPADTVVMNPPFHQGRKADPDLGRDFVTAAAKILSPRGTLWMVANRHLPYETTLRAVFSEVQEHGSDARFKIFRAAKPLRKPGKRS